MLTLYKSSAGSGKTFTLVLAYLDIVLRNPYEYKYVLAITFTNKATAEMKARIIHALEQLAETPMSAEIVPMYNALRARGGFEEVDISERARTTLRLILQDYAHFSVSTIESFFQRVLRAFTQELDIPLAYEVEMRQDFVMDALVRDVLMDIDAHPMLQDALMQLVERNMDEGRGWNIEKDIREQGREIFKEGFQEREIEAAYKNKKFNISLDEYSGYIAGLRKMKRDFEDTLRQLSREAREKMTEYGLEIEDFFYGKSGVGKFLTLFESGKFPESQKLTTNSYVQKVANGGAWYGQKAAPAKKAAIDAISDHLMDILQQMLGHIEQGKREYVSVISVLKNIYVFGLLSYIQEKLVEYRKNNNVLLVSDTNILLRNVIMKQEDTPFIYEKVGSQYKYFLIDEFQDTSAIQWSNLFPLLLNALSSASDSYPTGYPSLVVGDAKQSIYRWRNGDMRLLLKGVADDFQLKYGQSIDTQELKDNYRTQATIVNFNNTFFEIAPQLLADTLEDSDTKYLFDLAYAPETTAQNAKKPDGGEKNVFGYVQIDLIALTADEAEAATETEEETANSDTDEKAPWRESAHHHTLALVRKLKDEDGFRGGDITILVRTNGEATSIASFLQENGIDVSSAEGLRLSNHPEVHLLELLLQLLLHPTDKVTQTAASQLADMQHFTPEKYLSYNLYEAIERLRRDFQLLEPNAYMDGFLDALLEFSGTQEPEIGAFLSWWKEQKEKRSIAESDNPEAVKVITIHKSKGLEFPVVIMPFCEGKFVEAGEKATTLWVSPAEISATRDLMALPIKHGSALKESFFEEEYIEEKTMSYLDNMNVLYVAFTRAKYRLYICAPQQKVTKSGKPSAGLSRVSQLIAEAAKRMEGTMLQAAAEGENAPQITLTDGNSVSLLRYTAGKDGKFEPKKEASASTETKKSAPTSQHTLKTNAPHLPDWTKAARIRFSANRYAGGVLERNKKIAIGELLHLALSYVRTRADIGAAVQAMALRGEIASADAPALREALHAATTRPSVADWFAEDSGWQVRNEAELLTATQGILRPDRVQLRENTALIIDYKTGKRNSKHSEQLSIYKNALQELGYTDVQCFLYYLQDGAIVEV